MQKLPSFIIMGDEESTTGKYGFCFRHCVYYVYIYLHLAVSRKITTTNKLIHRERARYAVVLLNKANQSYNNYIPSCRRVVVPKHSKW